jgi:hypothetical protein
VLTIASRVAHLTPGVLEEFIIYAQSHSGVTFMRNDEITRFALESPLTVREGI